jgi:hypothetical protein
MFWNVRSEDEDGGSVRVGSWEVKDEEEEFRV